LNKLLRFGVCLLLPIFFYGCFASHTPRDLFSNQLVHEQHLLLNYVRQHQSKSTFSFSFSLLRPMESDFYVYSDDLNNDGKIDFIGTVRHFRFTDEAGGYPVYVFMADDYGYKLLQKPFYTSATELSFSGSVVNNYKSFTLGGHEFTFDGTIYK
jgi:hypothetical protein